MDEPAEARFEEAGPEDNDGGLVSRGDASALADLQMHWDEAYEIGLDGHIWRARFRTSPDELRAHTCYELRELIRGDYAYRQRAGQAHWRTDDTAPDNTAPDDDTYEDAYESDSEEPPPPVPVRPDYTGLRGERMSI